MGQWLSLNSAIRFLGVGRCLPRPRPSARAPAAAETVVRHDQALGQPGDTHGQLLVTPMPGRQEDYRTREDHPRQRYAPDSGATHGIVYMAFSRSVRGNRKARGTPSGNLRYVRAAIRQRDVQLGVIHELDGHSRCVEPEGHHHQEPHKSDHQRRCDCQDPHRPRPPRPPPCVPVRRHRIHIHKNARRIRLAVCASGDLHGRLQSRPRQPWDHWGLVKNVPHLIQHRQDGE